MGLHKTLILFRWVQVATRPLKMPGEIEEEVLRYIEELKKGETCKAVLFFLNSCDVISLKLRLVFCILARCPRYTHPEADRVRVNDGATELAPARDHLLVLR